jgi:hypothetical protein
MLCLFQHLPYAAGEAEQGECVERVSVEVEEAEVQCVGHIHTPHTDSPWDKLGLLGRGWLLFVPV